MSEVEKIDSADFMRREEDRRFCAETNCLGAKDQDWNKRQEIEAVPEQPPSYAGRQRFQQVIRELNNKFEELHSAVSQSPLLRHCTSPQDDHYVITRRRDSLAWSEKCRSYVSPITETGNLLIRTGRPNPTVFSDLSDQSVDVPHLHEHAVNEYQHAPECTGETSICPSSAGSEERKSGNFKTEELQEEMESEIEKPQALTILEEQSQVPALNQDGALRSASLTVEKFSDVDSYPDTVQYAKEIEAADLQSESYHSSQSILDEEDSLSLPAVDEISNHTDLEFCNFQVSDGDQDRENSELDDTASADLHQYQINSEEDNARNLNPEQPRERAQKEATEFSEKWESNSESDKPEDYQHCTGRSDHGQETMDPGLDIPENQTSQLASSQPQKEAKLSERRPDIKDRESSDKQELFVGTKIPRMKSNTTKLVAFFSGINNQTLSSTSSDKEQSTLSSQIPSPEKTSISKVPVGSTERHPYAPFVCKHRKTPVSREAVPVTKSKEISPRRNFRSIPVPPKALEVRKPDEVRGVRCKGQNTALQDDAFVQTDVCTKSEESAAENPQSVEGILTVLESMQRTLAKTSSSSSPSIKAQFPHDALPGRLEQEQIPSNLGPRMKQENTCCKQEEEEKEEEEEAENARKSLLAYNIANHIVGQAVKKIMELYPEYFVKQSDAVPDAEPNSTDSSSMTLALAALKEVLQDLNGSSKREMLEDEGPKPLISTAVGTSPLLLGTPTTDVSHSIASEIVEGLVASAVSAAHLSDKTVQTEARCEDSSTPSDAGKTMHAYLPEEHARQLSFQFVTEAMKETLLLLSNSVSTSTRCSASDSSMSLPSNRAFETQGGSTVPSAESVILESAAFSNIMHGLSNNVYSLVKNVVSLRQSSEAEQDVGTDKSRTVRVLSGLDVGAFPASVRDKDIVSCQSSDETSEKNVISDCNHCMLGVNKEKTCGSDKVSSAVPEEFLQGRNIWNKRTKPFSNVPGTEAYSNPSFKHEQEVTLQVPRAWPGPEEKHLGWSEENRLSPTSFTAAQSQTSRSSVFNADNSIERLVSTIVRPNLPQLFPSDSLLQSSGSSDLTIDPTVLRLLQLQIERERMNREMQGMLYNYLHGDTSSSLQVIDNSAPDMAAGRPDHVPYAGAFRPVLNCNRIRCPRSQREDPLPEGSMGEHSTSRSVTSLRPESRDVRGAYFSPPRQGHDLTRGISAGKDLSSSSEPKLSLICRKPDHILPGGRDAIVQTPDYDCRESSLTAVASASSYIKPAAAEAASAECSDGHSSPVRGSVTENKVGSSSRPCHMTTSETNRQLEASSVDYLYSQALASHMVTSQEQTNNSKEQAQSLISQVVSLQKAMEAVDEQLQDLRARHVEMIREHSASKEEGSPHPAQAPSSPLRFELSSNATCLPGERSLAENEMEQNAGGFGGFVTRKFPGETRKDVDPQGSMDASQLPSQYFCISVPPWKHEVPLDSDEDAAGNVCNGTGSAGTCRSNTSNMESTIKEDLKRLQSAVNTLSDLVYKQYAQNERCNRHFQRQTTLRRATSPQSNRKVLVCLQPQLSSSEDGRRSTGGYGPDLFPDHISSRPSQSNETNALKSGSAQTQFCQGVGAEIFATGNSSELRHAVRSPDVTSNRTFHKPVLCTLSEFSNAQPDESGHLSSSFICRHPTQTSIGCQHDSLEHLKQSKINSSIPSPRLNWTSRTSYHTGMPLRWKPVAAVDILRNGGNIYSCVGIGDNPEHADLKGNVSSCIPSAHNEDFCQNGSFPIKSSNAQSGDCNPDTKWFSGASVNSGATEKGVPPQRRGLEEHVQNHLAKHFTGMKSSEQKSEPAKNAPLSEDAATQGRTFRPRLFPSNPRSPRSLKGLSLVPLLMSEAEIGVVHAFDGSASAFMTDDCRGKAFQPVPRAVQENFRIPTTCFRPEPLGALGLLTEVDTVPSSVDAEVINTKRLVSFTSDNLEAVGSDRHFAGSSGTAESSEPALDADKLSGPVQRINKAGTFINMDDAQTGIRHFPRLSMSSKLWNCNSSSLGCRKEYDKVPQHNTRNTGTTKNKCQEVTLGPNNHDLKSFRQIHSSPDRNIQSVAEDQISHDLSFSSQAAGFTTNTVSCKPTLCHQIQAKLLDGDFSTLGENSSFSQRRLKTDTDTESGDFTGPNSSFNISTPGLSDLTAGELDFGNPGSNVDFSTSFSDEEKSVRKMNTLHPCVQGGMSSTTKTQTASVREAKACQNNCLGTSEGSLFRCNKRPGDMDSILDNVEQTPPAAPYMKDSISSTWNQSDNHDKMSWHKPPKLFLARTQDEIKEIQQWCTEQSMQERLGPLSCSSNSQELPVIGSIIKNLSTIFDVKNCTENTAPQLACGGYQLLQLVQHQISGSKEIIEMGKKMSSSHGHINSHTNSGPLRNALSNQENAVTTTSSSNTPCVNNGSSSPIAFTSGSNQTFSSASRTGSTNSLSLQDDPHTQRSRLP